LGETPENRVKSQDLSFPSVHPGHLRFNKAKAPGLSVHALVQRTSSPLRIPKTRTSDPPVTCLHPAFSRVGRSRNSGGSFAIAVSTVSISPSSEPYPAPASRTAINSSRA
jgi:hypothetical protein